MRKEYLKVHKLLKSLKVLPITFQTNGKRVSYVQWKLIKWKKTKISHTSVCLLALNLFCHKTFSETACLFCLFFHRQDKLPDLPCSTAMSDIIWCNRASLWCTFKLHYCLWSCSCTSSEDSVKMAQVVFALLAVFLVSLCTGQDFCPKEKCPQYKVVETHQVGFGTVHIYYCCVLISSR